MANLAREQLAHHLRMKFGIPPSNPTDRELDAVIGEIQRVRATRGAVSEQDWKDAVKRHVVGVGTYIYHGLDFSDLNALLQQALQAAAQGKR